MRLSRQAGEDIALIEKEIRDLDAEYDRLQGQIRIGNPRYAGLTQPEPLDLEAIREQVLDGGTMLLEYALGDERSYLWAVTRTEMSSYVLPPRQEIEALARRMRELLTVRQQPKPDESARQFRQRAEAADGRYWETAGELSRLILAPAADLLQGHRLLVVPDGLLQYIPFAALPVPESAGNGADGPVPLVAGHEIVRLPSASTLGVLRRELQGRKPAGKSVAVFADPVVESDDPRLGEGAVNPARSTENRTGLVRLPSTRREAEAIMSVVPGDGAMSASGLEASRETATSAGLSGYRVVHFATHGIIDDRHPNLSALVLSTYDGKGQPQDGFLRLHDIYNLELPAELVVLSGCETALGKEVRGEGLIGLVRGFMYAGAARVLASLWKVQDESTAELMRRFYGKMLGEGQSPAAALRGAQVEMWRQGRYRAPYYWAGFVLQGEYR